MFKQTLLRRRPWRRAADLTPTRPLRCAFVITSMPVGGAETLLVNMMRRMDPNVIAPEVVCLKEPGPLGEAIRDEFPLHSDLIGGKHDVSIVWKLGRLFHSRRIDAVVTVGAGDKMFWGRLAATAAGVPVIASALHSTGWPDGVGRLNRTLTSVTDAFIGVADSHGEFLCEFEKFPGNKVHVIRNGIDCNRFRADTGAGVSLRDELGLTPTNRLVGIVAALRHEKNHTMLVRAAQEIASRESHQSPSHQTHWVIVGDGPERATIDSLASQLGVADRIHLLGDSSRHRQDCRRPRRIYALFAQRSIPGFDPGSTRVQGSRGGNGCWQCEGNRDRGSNGIPDSIRRCRRDGRCH